MAQVSRNPSRRQCTDVNQLPAGELINAEGEKKRAQENDRENTSGGQQQSRLPGFVMFPPETQRAVRYPIALAQVDRQS
jgi:hypothetical protein